MKRCLYACFLFLLSAVSHAQPGPGLLKSVEAMTAESVLIVRGSFSTRPEPALQMYGGSRTVVRVKETLKGSPQPEVVIPTFSRDKAIGEGEGLLFLAPASQSSLISEIQKAFPHAYVPLGMVRLEGPGPLAMSMSMEKITKGDDVLRLVKKSLGIAPRTEEPRDWSFMLPRTLKDLPPHRETGMGVLLQVPIDPRLEALAHEWMTSQDAETRKIGANAILFFKDRQNIERVKRLLKDPYAETYNYFAPRAAMKVRVVREAAKDTLDKWDIPWEPVHKASIAAARKSIRVPAGEFTMGGTPGAQEAEPERKVHVKEFWIGKTPVTVAQYRAFCKATGFRYDWVAHRPQHGYKDDHPMVNVIWEEARAFCKWVGGDLPTEEQWEKAARGTDGRRYPWGNDWDREHLHGWENHFTSWRATAPVGSYPSGASPYGCLDLVGNVWQWCLGGAPTQRPSRGSDYQTSETDQRFTQVAGRGFMHGDGRLPTQGFRVAGSRKLVLP